jgi:hypothetical protein
MAGIKISELVAAPLAALTDVFPIVQAGVTYKLSTTQLATLFNSNLSYVPLAGGTMTGALILNTNTPSTALQAASKGYVDSIAQGLNIQGACRVATTAALTVTYANGTAGVGATLTNAGAFLALSIDGVTLAVADRVLVKNQVSTFQNGIYTVTNVGDNVSVNWVMTRATDYDEPAEIQPGDFVVITAGSTNTNSSWLETATVVTIGTDPITFVQFSASLPVTVASGGTGVTSTTAFGVITGGTTSTAPFQNAGAGLAGQLFQSAGPAALGGYTTATYPTTAGTSGNIITSNGTNFVSTAPVYFSAVTTQVFTVNGTYTPTTGMKYASVEVVGGGGGGGGVLAGAASTGGSGAAGGGGGYARKIFIAATIGASQAVTVGTGGNGGAAGVNPGVTGGTTSLGALISATGGAGGIGSTASGATFTGLPGGAGGVGSSGDFNTNGTPGSSSVWTGAGARSLSGSGGSSFFGGGALGQLTATHATGISATSYGGGGSGGVTADTTSAAGGNGFAGIIIITEYR